ncbi:hypothetical protein [Deinococcus aquiradiocola]|uniref:Tetratricopeptide repeat protein n=1 Tax=Deinococcus aquiradiocola TaxID=393059 RepID=A0A917PJ51_9DEIO|nr:hypothetical protein [Deinococcus aquiradiocola]GGJ80380.1 hypothetical protein GCM10008939_25320 [Deinococcus aquiradiocola]
MNPSVLYLLPDLGDLLRLQPQYNAATLVELTRALPPGPPHAPHVLWLTGPDPDHPARDAFAAAGTEVSDLSPDWTWAHAEHDALKGFMKQYPQGQERLRRAAHAEQDLQALLGGPLTLESLTSARTQDGIRAYHAALQDALDEGPGTRWHARRLDTLARTLQDRTGVALAALDDLPDLLDRLPHAALPDPATFQPGEASRRRALADRALLLDEHDDLMALLGALEREPGDRVTPAAELRYAAANIHLAVGDLPAARTHLESAAHALTDERSLPGLVLARLGQVRDAQGERDLATRTYRAVLALTYAPQAARDAALAGLDAPFTLDLTPRP